MSLDDFTDDSEIIVINTLSAKVTASVAAKATTAKIKTPVLASKLSSEDLLIPNSIDEEELMLKGKAHELSLKETLRRQATESMQKVCVF